MKAGDAHAIMDTHARSFAPATRLLPRAQRDMVARLYAICRIVDDLADCAEDRHWADARLRRIEEELRTHAPRDPVSQAAGQLFSGKPAGIHAFADLVAGVRSDLGSVRIDDGRALTAYCSAVAGTVGIMICVLFDVDTRHHAAADAMGRAMQLTNICRDVLEDARLGRRYLPATLCPHDPSEILSPDATMAENVQNATALLLDEAEALYEAGFAALDALPLRLRLAVAVAAYLYRGIGRRLHARNCDPLQGRVRLPRTQKAALALSALPHALRPPLANKSEGPTHA